MFCRTFNSGYVPGMTATAEHLLQELKTLPLKGSSRVVAR